MDTKQIAASDSSGIITRVFVFGEPQTCLFCKTPLVHSGSAHFSGLVVYRYSLCRLDGCSKINVLVYRNINDSGRPFHYSFVEQQVAVQFPTAFPEITDRVAALSPQFVEVYGQALATEQLRLTQVTGLALRKSLEFLVKDYSLAQYPQDREVIEKKPLAKCIEDYIRDPYLKEAVKRATWLGNDEAHYSRRWLDHDLNDLKRLILLTIGWLHNALVTDEYLRSMPEVSKKPESLG
jgi:hypothetical protein